MKSVVIEKANCAYEPELFKSSFGFKGRKLTGVWQTVVHLSSGNTIGIGLGVESVLWSDAAVFARYGENQANALMFAVTEYATKLSLGMTINTPCELIEAIFEKCLDYANRICDMRVSKTFVLNALVPLDFAVWQLFTRLGEIENFDGIFLGTGRQDKLANIPLITYGTDISEIRRMAESGVPIFKIKLGSDPEGDGDPEKMLEWDKKRALAIHKALLDIKTPFTDCGGIVYYFDANGRYDTKERLLELTDFLVNEGIAERTVLFEEPFSEENKLYVGDIPICFAADESAHSTADVRERIELGYRAITLKPIAKTASVSIEMAKLAYSLGAECFCADLTVNPYMVEWNKNFAARLSPIKGMKIGVLESNGAQNYVRWEKMKSYISDSPRPDEPIMTIGLEFYMNGGGIFEIPQHYLELTEGR